MYYLLRVEVYRRMFIVDCQLCEGLRQKRVQCAQWLPHSRFNIIFYEFYYKMAEEVVIK